MKMIYLSKLKIVVELETHDRSFAIFLFDCWHEIMNMFLDLTTTYKRRMPCVQLVGAQKVSDSQYTHLDMYLCYGFLCMLCCRIRIYLGIAC